MMNNKAPSPEYFGSEVLVWWDMDRCPIPDGYDARKVGPCIKSELEKLGYSGGPLTIFGLGDLKRIPEHVLQALLSTGMVLRNFPAVISGSSFLSSMLFGDKHPPPATILVITDSCGLERYANGLSWLQKDRKRNILLAYQDAPKGDYPLVTHHQWLWKSLLKDAKCRETVDFSCDICYFACQSFEEATMHLKGEAHALNELRLEPSSKEAAKEGSEEDECFSRSLFFQSNEEEASKEKGEEVEDGRMSIRLTPVNEYNI